MLLGLLCLNWASRCKKINYRHKSLSYVSPSIWNKLPDFLKTTEHQNKTFFAEWTINNIIYSKSDQINKNLASRVVTSQLKIQWSN